jgi:serine/threonine protein phosphatase 1
VNLDQANGFIKHCPVREGIKSFPVGIHFIVKEGEIMKVKLFVFSDVHGEDTALLMGLRDAGFEPGNPQHIPVCNGDLFDRGEGSRKLFDFMLKNHGIWIKGNHEIMLEEALEKGLDGEFVFFNMLHNGLDKTIASFANRRLDGVVSTPQMEEAIKMAQLYRSQGTNVLDKLKSLPLYYETKNYIFVHAGVDPYIHDWKQTPEDFMTWDIEASHLPIESTRKTVIIGHHHAFRVRARGEEQGWLPEPLRIPYFGNTDEHAPVRFGNKIAIDPCSNLTHKINILVIEDELLEETKKEEVEQRPEEPTITVSRGDMGSFRVAGEWIDPTITNYTYTAYTTTANMGEVYVHDNTFRL